LRADAVVSKAFEILTSTNYFADKLRVATFTAEIERALERYKPEGKAINSAELRFDIDRIKARFGDELAQHAYKHVPSGLPEFYEQLHLFGERVSEKFPKARADIKEAGSCYTLERPTACVFHLMRGIEAAVQQLGRKIGVTVTPQMTWRKITGDMDAKIRTLPDRTPRQKELKDRWAEARANLNHVGQVWRNNTMHPAVDHYSMAQAKEILDASRVLMRSLCEI